jgi:hypothetical protein
MTYFQVRKGKDLNADNEVTGQARAQGLEVRCGKAGVGYDVRIVFWRLLMAHARWPAPRAHSDLTHNPEISEARDRQVLEQHARDLDLPCPSPRCRVWFSIEPPALVPPQAPEPWRD